MTASTVRVYVDGALWAELGPASKVAERLLLLALEGSPFHRMLADPDQYPDARAAWRALQGDTDACHGPKVRQFARALLGAQDVTVIDVWMLRAMGEPVGNGPKPAQYAKLARHLTNAARLASFPVRDFQAAIWLTIREPQRELGI